MYAYDYRLEHAFLDMHVPHQAVNKTSDEGPRQLVRQRLCRVNVGSQAWHYEFTLGNCAIDCEDITQTKFKKSEIKPKKNQIYSKTITHKIKL